MFVKRNQKIDEQKLTELVNSDPEIKKQHDAFEEEMRFKQKLINARKAASMTQREIGIKSGLSQQAVSRLEKGHGTTVETLIKYLNSIGYRLKIEKM